MVLLTKLPGTYFPVSNRCIIYIHCLFSYFC